MSSAEPWMAEIEAALSRGAGPTAIWDRLKRLDPEFTVSVSAVKRVARRIARQSPVRAEDVVIPVETEPFDTVHEANAEPSQRAALGADSTRHRRGRKRRPMSANDNLVPFILAGESYRTARKAA